MLIRFFSKEYISQYIALLFVQIILWLPAFIFPESNLNTNISTTSPASNLISLIVSYSPLLSVIIAFIIVFLSAFILNHTLDSNQIVAKNNLLPAFIYIVLMSHRPILLSLYPMLVANLFIIIALSHFFTLYMEKEAYSKNFNIGILIAIGSLFYFDIFLLLIFLWLTYNIYRIYTWREWVIPILGFVTIYLFLGVYYFVTDQQNLSWINYQSHFQSLFAFQISFPKDYFSIIINTSVYLLSLVALANLIIHLNEYIISVRKHYWSSIMLLLISVIIVFFTSNSDPTSISLLLTPMSIIVAWFLLRQKKTFWMDIYLWLLLSMIMFHNYYSIFSKQIFE